MAGWVGGPRWGLGAFPLFFPYSSHSSLRDTPTTSSTLNVDLHLLLGTHKLCFTLCLFAWVCGAVY
jgi:hypothetical protein